jgi:hypothetical protein
MPHPSHSKREQPPGAVPWEIFGRILRRGLTDAGQKQLSGLSEVVDQLREWGGHLTRHALEKWAFAVIAPTPCEAPRPGHERCGNRALATCDLCGRRVCLAHARIDYLADAICEPCIGEAKARVRGGARPAAGDQKIKEAFRVLRLSPTASHEQVKKQYKALVVRYNADRPQSDRQRLKNTERLVRINEAYGVLEEHFRGTS